MNDVTYAQNKARLIAFREEARQLEELRDETMREAVARGEAYVLVYWYLRYEYRTPYFTLEEAIERAQEDCSPEHIIAPDGTLLSHYDGEKLEVQR
jgi:hypothetical protein